ncbi:tyrosine-type recombinase/integrase [Flavimobilis sp. GY10621]|uniref:Tyrosine-type recombinase/integrase n=1 Tax=Flavimobilis rhizosphaerae TaxID=2775421 RepID=A0ABR9DTM1_9MICO|nr:tyrosine-type recombinase/integrase [Flavimobilis rhizosphaerae]MBD9700487.1 tyrosine-type recombinase/integrase [Flavimobilis rhizosphaerae]
MTTLEPLPASWAEALTRAHRHMAATGASRSTLALRRSQLRNFASACRHLAPADVTAEDLAAWIGHGAPAPETRRTRRSSLVAFFDADPATAGAANPARRLAQVAPSNPRPRPVGDTDYRAALASADDREALMLRLAAEVGLRRGEVARVHSRDLLEDDDGWTLLVHGKGARDRFVPLTDALAATLRALPAGYAFPDRDAGHLTPAHVGRIVGRLLPSGVTMHALRHRFATRAYRLEHDLFVVQQLLGHTSPTVTRRYVQTTRNDMRRAVVALERKHS